MLLLDGSDSIKDADWIKMKQFTKQLIMSLDVARDAMNIGIVVYSTEVGDSIGVNPFKDKNRLRLLAGVLRQPKASTNTAKGIQYVRDTLKQNGRPGVPKIIVVITDGSSDNPTDTALQANLAKAEGITVLAVGVGGQMFLDELQQIASKPSDVLTSKTFRTLPALVSDTRGMLCRGILFHLYLICI